MSIKQSMRDVDRAVEDAIGSRDEYEADKEGPSPREVYERTIEEVSEVAGKAEAERLAAWIENTVRDERDLPADERVREKAVEVCEDAGESVAGTDRFGE
jgi:hypothetical protein